MPKLTEVDYVYLWVDRIHLKLRLESERVCRLVMMGVRAGGRKERRGMRPPVLAVGDGALGCWKAIPDVFPDTREPRCGWHTIGHVRAALPESAHPGANKPRAEIHNAEDREHAEAAAKAFVAPLARRQRTPPGRARPRRGPIRQGRPCRTTRRPRITM